MREINLPISQTFSMPLDVRVLNGDGKYTDAPLGTMVVDGKAWSEIEAARKNGGSILYATTSIERKIEGILLDYFMGPFARFDPKRNIFEREILKSSALSFNAKKELVVKVLTENELLPGKKKNTAQKYLKSIMDWRNAFAHGTIIHDSKRGCVLEYYSGHSRKLNLSDGYWDEVEISFKQCESLLDEVSKRLSNIPPQA